MKMLVPLALALALLAPFGLRAQEAPPRAAEPSRPALEPLLVESAKLGEELDALIIEGRALRLQLAEESGEDFRVMERQLAEKRFAFLDLTGKLVDNLLAQEAAGLRTSSLRPQVEQRLRDLTGQIDELIEREAAVLSELRVKREDVKMEELLGYEQEIARQSAWMDGLYRGFYRHTGWLEAAGLDAAAARAVLGEDLGVRAARQAARVRLVAEKIAATRKHAPADAELVLTILAVRRDAVAGSLGSTIRMLDQLGIDAAEYQKLLISTTGEVTKEIFRTEVVLGLLEEWLDQVGAWIRRYGGALVLKVGVFFAIVGLFWAFGRLARVLVRRAIGSGRMRTSQLLQDMTQALVGRTIVVFGVLFALSQLGLEIGPLLAGLGIMGFIVGFALQDTLGNFAAGMMILGYHPFDVGDTVEVGEVFGKVSHMSLVSTTILTFDNQTLIVPNGKIWGDVIKNVTDQQRRRIDMSFRVSYDDDVDHVERVLRDIVTSHEKVLEDPEPNIRIHKLEESHIEWIVRPWTRTKDYWSVYWDVTRDVKRRFDAEGITIPVAQREVRIHDERLAAEDAQRGPRREIG